MVVLQSNNELPGIATPDCDRANITIGLALPKWLPEDQLFYELLMLRRATLPKKKWEDFRKSALSKFPLTPFDKRETRERNSLVRNVSDHFKISIQAKLS